MLRRIIFCSCIMPLVFICIMPIVASADDATTLYYLMELQRKRGAPCAGATKMPVPSLMPSANLAGVAQAIASTPFVAEEIKQAFGADADEVFFSTLVAGATTKEAVDTLKSTSCTRLMHPKYTYVGAVRLGTSWSIVLASNDFSLAQEGATSAGDGADSGTHTGVGVTEPVVPSAKQSVGGAASSPDFAGSSAEGNDLTGNASGFESVPPPPPPPLPSGGSAQTVRSGITPLHNPPSLNYGSTQGSALYSMPSQNSSVSRTPSTPPTSLETGGGKSVQTQEGESVLLLNRDGKQVPVIITDEFAEESMFKGGVHIDKSTQ